MKKVNDYKLADYISKAKKKGIRYLHALEIKALDAEDETEAEQPHKEDGLVISNNSVYEYDMDCLKKNKKCH